MIFFFVSIECFTSIEEIISIFLTRWYLIKMRKKITDFIIKCISFSFHFPDHLKRDSREIRNWRIRSTVRNLLELFMEYDR